jgi:hypothetical protein
MIVRALMLRRSISDHWLYKLNQQRPSAILIVCMRRRLQWIERGGVRAPAALIFTHDVTGGQRRQHASDVTGTVPSVCAQPPLVEGNGRMHAHCAAPRQRDVGQRAFTFPFHSSKRRWMDAERCRTLGMGHGRHAEMR